MLARHHHTDADARNAVVVGKQAPAITAEENQGIKKRADFGWEFIFGIVRKTAEVGVVAPVRDGALRG